MGKLWVSFLVELSTKFSTGLSTIFFLAFGWGCGIVCVVNLGLVCVGVMVCKQ